MVTDQQALLLRRKIMEGKSQQAAAGMSARSARRWRRGPLPSEKRKRSWRTRPDAFAGVWDEEIALLLRRDASEKLQATALLEWLDESEWYYVSRQPSLYLIGRSGLPETGPLLLMRIMSTPRARSGFASRIG